MSAIAKSTFCFLHSLANIAVCSRVGGCAPYGRGSIATLCRKRFIGLRQHTRHGLDSSQDFLSVEVGMHRQRQSRVRQRLAGGEITGSVAEVSERGLKMKRDRVVNSAFDFFLKQRVANGVAARAPNDEEVIAGLRIRGFEDRLSVQRREQLAISGGNDTAA